MTFVELWLKLEPKPSQHDPSRDCIDGQHEFYFKESVSAVEAPNNAGGILLRWSCLILMGEEAQTKWRQFGERDRGPAPKEKRRRLKLQGHMRRNVVGPARWNEERPRGSTVRRPLCLDHPVDAKMCRRTFSFTKFAIIRHSLIAFSSTPFLVKGGLSSGTAVTAMNPKVKTPETTLLGSHMSRAASSLPFRRLRKLLGLERMP
ncbi:hypothetical protein CRG98_043283 [Punica granatum]|uniref:Uncharacterized protein n=1 Tax=Punica granatum TaxID=22663 RepID=A0A2I0HXA6_PUNGR|nr:hypothetical protein CRG98_043283 [Punica granatum]